MNIPAGTCGKGLCASGGAPECEESIECLSPHCLEEIVSQRRHVARELVDTHVICVFWRKKCERLDDIVCQALNRAWCAVC